MRTSASQFQLLVEYMERNGDLSKPTEGPHGRATNLQRWTEVTNLLNADSTGDTKTVEKWRKVWSDLKNNTKKKSARIHRAARGTGGGPACRLTLSDLEQRVLSIMGTRAATGIVEIPEVGLEEEVIELPTLVLPPDSNNSPSIFQIQEQLVQQTCSNIEDRNLTGTPQAQPSIFPPWGEQDLVGREEPETLNSTALHLVDRSDTEVTHGGEPAVTRAPLAATSIRQHAPQSPTPLPPTPRRRRRRPPQNQSSPVYRRTRTQTQSDLARQAFVRSDCEWRAFQQEAERERLRLRELELRMQERWMDLFGQFLVLGNRIVDCFEKK